MKGLKLGVRWSVKGWEITLQTERKEWGRRSERPPLGVLSLGGWLHGDGRVPPIGEEGAWIKESFPEAEDLGSVDGCKIVDLLKLLGGTIEVPLEDLDHMGYN